MDGPNGKRSETVHSGARTDRNGTLTPVQYVEGRACSYVRGLPPMSGKAFRYITDQPGVYSERCFGGSESGKCIVHADSDGFETPFFKGSFDAAMRITSMIDRRNGRELCKPGAAYRLNIPVMVIPVDRKDSVSQELLPFVQINRDNVIVETVKQQMDGEDTIVRLYECYGARSEAVMTFGVTPRSVETASLMEDALESVPLEGNQIRFLIRPYEILTFRIKY